MKKLISRVVFRGLGYIAAVRALAWFLGADAQVAAFVSGNKLASLAILAVLLIWTHLLWDVERAKLRLAYDLRTHGLVAVLRAKRPKQDDLELLLPPRD